MKIFIVAGEPSGDFHASELIHALKKARPDVEFYSAGGSNLRKCTVQVVDMTEIAVNGIMEVIGVLPKILTVLKKLKQEIDKIDPDIVIFTDFPDFNFRLAGKVVKKGRKLVYFIGPQLWAWRKGRIRLVKHLIDKMLVIFPFEAEFYRKQKVRATFVGNPLVNTIRKRHKEGLVKTENTKPRILLLPGSRRKEIKMSLETMCGAKILIEKNLDADFHVLKHPDLPMELFQPAEAAGIPVIEADSFEEFARTDLAIACSGTVTVELALSGVPTVVMYKMAPVTFFMAKALVKVSAISMPNIILGHHVFPELIQDEANPENIAEKVCDILCNSKLYGSIQADLKKFYGMLGPFDPKLAASEVLST